jgi:hypothetical protein
VGRYIVRYVGEGLRPAADAQRIREAPGVTVLDDGTHMLLVETSPKRLKELMDSLPGWIWTPERSIRLPDPRPRPRRKPGD